MPLDTIIWLLLTYKYLLLFPLTVVEGPITTVMGGLLTSLGYLNLAVVYIVVVVGDLVGDCLYYALGYYGRTQLITRWGGAIGISPERVRQLEEHFGQHSGKTLVLGKLSHAVGAVVLVAAGAAKVPWRTFLGYNLLATLPKSLLLLLIGYYFGRAYTTINTYLDYTAVIMVSMAVILVVLYFLMRALSKRYEDTPGH